ncbi:MULTISPECIES: S-layer family protein [unclassified Nodularia (in: cyanobacteria)]|uniref:two-partner secretion domain-containing protein n=1 Tax=unclassified Nodularia (in: cyanobacteria) TaxID=2656917 RepID=UPI00188120C0|nr:MULTISPECIES: S-layer family protein [unclassified Nodularia (in: cyanobacteria)]MBE9200504.1 S-layer family protein [Nodularia sp. LEGE 06071]MCC2691212.1 S-layer family protein [Nodularia sp. LEGE 04288]
MKVTSVCWGVAYGILVGGNLLPAMAQVTSDATTNTIVNSNGNNFDILNGINQGNNLFHSFSNFSIPTGGSATFDLTNTPNTTTIFSRVTGENISHIDGLIRTLHGSNPVSLFLMNPNGIVFGQNASLNISGSFVGTTANSIKFADGIQFGTTDSTIPPLLTMSIPIGLQFGQGAATITNRADLSANQGLTLASNAVLSTAMLTSPNGAVQIQATTGDAQLQAIAARSVDITAQGNVNVGAINTNSSIDSGGLVNIQAGRAITVNDTINTATTAAIGNAGNVSLSSGGDLTIQSINASVGERSGSNNTNGNGGDISLQSNGHLLVQDSATIETRNSRNQGVGNSGSVNIVTRSLSQYGTVFTDTRGQGNAGKITVQAADLILIAGKEGGTRSGFSAVVDRGAIGNANNIQITAGSLTMKDVSLLSTNTFGMGNAGYIDVQTDDLISLYGRVNIFSNVESGAIGNSAGVSLKAGSLTAEFIDFTKVPNIFSSVLGEGNGGNITLNVRDSISLSGARIRALVDGNGKGVGGNIDIRVGSALYANNNTLINTRASTFGKAGNINIQADSITLDGVLPAEGFPTTINTSTRSANAGGQITLTSRTFSLLNGARLDTNTLNSGDAGDVTIQTSEFVLLDNVEKTDPAFFISGQRNISEGRVPSFIRSEVQGVNATGNGGNVQIQTPVLIVSNGAYISSSSTGQGNAGNIEITSDAVTFAGVGRSPLLNNDPNPNFPSGAFSLATANGNGGNITIKSTDSVSINGNAQLSVSSSGQGTAGNLDIQTNQLQLKQSSLQAEAVAGSQGNILILSDLLLMLQGSQITANAKEDANGGNITIDAPIILGWENSDIAASAFKGKGGNIQITTEGIFGLQFRPQITEKSDITASSQFGVSGTVDINNFGIDPNSGLVELPKNVTDPSQQITTGCTDNQGSSFVATGRGGIPQNPNQQVWSDRTWSDIRDLSTYQQTQALKAPIPKSPESLVQATSWRRNTQGQVQLITDKSSAQVQQPLTCAAVTQN